MTLDELLAYTIPPDSRDRGTLWVRSACALVSTPAFGQARKGKPAPAPVATAPQKVDEEYTRLIKEYLKDPADCPGPGAERLLSFLPRLICEFKSIMKMRIHLVADARTGAHAGWGAGAPSRRGKPEEKRTLEAMAT
jgi:hypothetical protein